MSAVIYNGSRLELANEFFVASSELTVSSTHKHEREKSSSIGLIAVSLILLLGAFWFLVYTFIVVPLSIFIYSVLNVIMFFAYRNIKRNVRRYSFEYTKGRLQDTVELRNVIKEQLDRMNKLGKFPLIKVISFGIKGIHKKVLKIEKALENTLYVDMTSYSKEDISKYNEFLDSVKDVWEEDNDLIYSKDTHKLLTDQDVQKN